MLSSLVQKSIRIVPWSMRSWFHRIPIFSQLQRHILKSFVAGREFIHQIDAGPARGLKFPVILPTDKNVWTGTYELKFVTALAESIRPGDVCFDIGGWRGYCSGVMAVRGAASVQVFEPLPENIERINRLIQVNPTLPIKLEPAAVGQQTGVAQFKVMSETSMGKLADSTFQEDASASDFREVKIHSLDDWVKDKGVCHVDVMKIDVEGAEMLVLNGAQSLIETYHPRLFVEVHSPLLAKQVEEFLLKRNYKIRSLCSEKTVENSDPEVTHWVAE